MKQKYGARYFLLFIIFLGVSFLCHGKEVQDEVRDTRSGHRFIRVSKDRLNRLGVTLKNVDKFGEVWQDEIGVVWGDIVKAEEGSDIPMYMNHGTARKYCKSIGGELPRGYPETLNGESGFPNKDSDFVRLSKYMGVRADSRKEYEAQVLPNLTYKHEDKIGSNFFWSSSVDIDDPDIAYVFHGQGGTVFSYDRGRNFIISTRCIFRPR